MYPHFILLVFATSFLFCCKGQDTVKSSAVSYKKHVISEIFVSEGVAVGDVNNDGKPDILAGQYWFEAPSWQRHLMHADTLNPIPGYSPTFINFCSDVNNDGLVDLIRFDQPGAACVWYENPKNKDGLWKMRLIEETAGNETPLCADVDKDGKPDIICNDVAAKQVIWLKSPTGKEDTLWHRFIISSDSTLGTDKYTHGLGWGDVNKDGRNDVMIKNGWWQSPADVKQKDWKFHRADFGQDCANLFAMDVDGDKDQDVISSSAHNYGIWWHEQKQNGNGNLTWVTHEISKLFSQSHSLALEDINGDGQPDLITGKRYFAHNGKDPGAFEPAVLYWFEYKGAKQPKWIPHLVDNNSGVGTNIAVKDITNDGLTDIITSNKKGVFLFEQIKK
jgi:hypothetical protein